ncbi:E3 ubiquitin-protein ligase rnf213-alpha-like [Mytilus galloprovincialis]|uniref:E3 ubiquitin-protein ligase rnf213-alpha-like n=1 Tax=Mytilus galloprovincialis TaxID=29158 RepID=UPI003F7C926A
MMSCAFKSLMIAADVLKSMHQRTGNKLRDNVMCLALDAFLTSLHVYYTTSAELSEKIGNDAQSESFKKTLDSVQSDVRMWLNTKMTLCRSELLPCLKAWNRVLNVVVPPGFIRDEFVRFISECLHEALKFKKSCEDELVKVYCQNQDSFGSAMLDVLSKYVFEAVVRLNDDIKIDKWKEDQLRNFGQLLSVVFEKSTATDCIKDPSSSLQFMLNWRPFPIYVKMCKNNIHSSFLSEKSVGMMKSLKECTGNLVKEIFDRSISVASLCIIEEKLERFTNIVKDIPDIEDKGLKKAIELRIAELSAYNECLKNLKQFIDICQRCDANTTVLEEQSRKFQELDKVALKDICAKVDIPKEVKKYKPRVIAFEIKRGMLEELPEVIRCSSGVLFIRIWDKLAADFRRTVKRALQVHEIMDHVWRPAYTEWKGLHQRLKTGEIFFKEFDTLCGSMQPETLKKEFIILEGGKKPSWIKERIEQMSRYKNLQNCLDGASIIMQVVEEFELEGDFQPIRQIMQMTKGKDTKMNKLKQPYMKTCSVLSDINERKVICLQKFMESKNLVNWLREKMEGLHELKTFVDLAYISTGDQGLEIAKVRCLQSAAIGYAPLIFNLESDCSYKDFLERCEEVWKALDSNQNLPSELLDTCHELEWLKIVDESQGSVEVTSLAQAEAINLNGTYHIGLQKTGDGNQRKGQNQLQLTDVQELIVTEKKEGKTLRREYNYEQLHDLQSRLMLVAGKAEMGKDDVDRFILILDSVVRLCNVYIKLLSSGCVLFSKFKVKFRCDPESITCAFVSFGEGDIKRTLRGKIDTVNKDVSFFIPKIAKFLEHCHERWLEFIDRKREDHYILNYFSIEQMVILQQELVKMGLEGEPSNQIYPLLSNIKHDCTREDLVDAMEEARDELEHMDIDEDEEVQEELPMEEENSEAAKGKFILQMVEAGYSEGLAREALKNVTPDQIDEGIAWCIEHEEEAMDFETTTTDGTSVQNQDKAFSGWSTKDESLATVRARLLENIGVGATQGLDSSVDVLIENLEKLWENFVGSISSSVTDYLSVEHLALILRKLADKETVSVERSFSVCGCKEGVANLIVCSQSEMYNTVLSLYSTEDDSLLPQSDEVLLCTPDTTLDLLEIFWRRSLFGDSGKIYCLVNADLLDYEVSDKGEKLLEKHMKNAQNRDIQFKLVVVCSRENEYKSRMVAALDKYRRPQMSFGGEKHVKTYLSERFIVDKPICGVEPASSVDFNRSSVRVVKSWRAGVGKSLFKMNMVNALMEKPYVKVGEENSIVVSIPLYDRTIVVDEVLEVLLEYTNPPHVREPRIFHFDISHEVQHGVDAFLFQLLVLGCLSHTSGSVWRRSDMDYYIIESMPLLARGSETQVGKLKCMHHCLDILPDVLCRSPKESLDIFDESFPDDFSETDLIFDEIEFASATYQRPYQYLSRLDGDEALTDINPEEPEGDREDCLQILLRHCGVKDPSWSELYHFVSFLNRQLQDFETSAFCSPIVLQDLPGFPSFVMKFLIQMSRDFATRSLQISEESPIDMLKRQLLDDEEDEEDIEELYEMRRKWESSPHPYLFFNPDHHTMTFLGFNIEKATGNLIDDQTGESLEDQIMDPTLDQRQRTLYNGLNSQPGVNLSENFDKLSRGEKIEKLCQVMGIEFPHDPDETYELTTDNVKKILAIYMRFRCDIPVIIMGETGCGKTRLIKFMCALQHLPDEPVENMIIMKVHGGTTTKDIIKKVRKAEEIAMENAEDHPNMFTVLFFDEANTTEAIGVIKEIMCDKSLGGNPIQIHERLKIIAACNPYRKHKEELIKKLEQAGLGYHVDADKTTDRLGRVPMRRLVYRVQPLPQSMLPLVWDFGQLNSRVEEMYIKQMVLRYVNQGKLPQIPDLADVTSRILSECQDFMRMQEDECSFVSLRDVERVLEVMAWFYRQTEEGGILFDEDEDADQDEDYEQIEITRALILALGVCYQACLQKRQDFRDMIADYFEEPYQLLDIDQLETELIRCQDKFLDSVKLADNIARNQALKENVFMMIVCIELRIPLFLVGKPGSSKSLAKTIVADAMQGDTARSQLFKKYKQVQMVSFQCSPLSTPDGILGTFRQCAQFQRKKDLDRFVSVVVLDEIGLAEDSPRMPLKTLHPLLEDGCSGDDDLEEFELKQTEEMQEDEEPEDPIYKKVAFIGISNWALDPAKMNRGIFVQREVPDEGELINSARGICRTSKDKERTLKLIDNLIPSLSKAYSELFSELEKSKQREFFGLRDFYSLIKMVYAFAARSEHKPTWLQLKHAIMRNFGGLENINSVEIFQQCLRDTTVVMNERRQEGDPDCSSGGMIKACLEGDSTRNTGETRYLLLLTENYGDLAILQQKVLMMHNAQVIFGSSFPSDQEYTQVCRNINRIKVCMETGSTVILLNLENLYESLYDALNQYYVYYGGQRYVDLGLGSHRVKCKVHEEFRLIVVAEKEIVYKKFPIPLINRLEKHVLSLSTMLSQAQLELANKLEDWVKDFCHVEMPFHLMQRERRKERSIGEVFMGYHADTCAAIIMQLFEDKKCPYDEIEQSICQEILHDAKTTLLWCAAPDAVMRLKSTKLRDKNEEMMQIYFKHQQHDSLLQYLCHQVIEEKKINLFAQVTTHSKLLSTPDLEDLCQVLPIQRQNMTLLTLQSFDTEQQFCRQIRFSLEKKMTSDNLLIVQCDCGDQNADLVACARYSIQGELQQISEKHSGNIHVVLIIQLPRVAGSNFTGFQCGLWHSLHIDDLRPLPNKMPSIVEMYHKPVSAFFDAYKEKKPTEDMEVDAEKDGEPDMDVDSQQETSQREQQIDILSLSMNCAHTALSMVKDPEKDSPRTTERIKMVLNLIQNNHEEEGKTFLSGIAVQLQCLLKEKEDQESELHKEWLSTEASNPDHINSAGTFRRAAIQCLEEKLASLLAGIIAFIDKNCNMNIVISEQAHHWQRFVWLNILNCPQVTQLHYTHSMGEHVVQGTAYEGGGFLAGMPFSWLIYNQIDEIMKTTFEEPGSHENHGLLELVMKTASRLESTPLGKILSQIEGTSIQGVICCYIKDFVHMAYPVRSESEQLNICENIMVGCTQIIQGEVGRLFPALVGCHAAFHHHKARFRNFSDIVHVWPECCEKVAKFQDNAEQEMMYLVTADEITLDLMGLHLLLKNLEPPSKDALNKPSSRKQWIRVLCDYRPVVERIFGFFRENEQGHDFSLRCTQAILTARHLWTRAIVLKLFIEHVCTDDSEVKRCMPLWVMLRTKADMKTLESLEKVEKFLKSCNKEVSSKIFGQQKCAHCEEPYTGTQETQPSPPVTLPCNHTICRRCFNETIISPDVTCPTCDQPFMKDFQPVEADQSEHVLAYQDFRRRCNNFFMEVISQLCFAEGTPPSNDIVNKLLSYITVQTKKGQEVTKQLTIFDDCIDSTPVVRSFLLQHLMQTSGLEVHQHLENYFRRALRLIDPTTSDQSHSLCHLVLQCMEDSCHQRYSEENKELIQAATEMLRNSCKKIQLDADHLLENMEHLSQTRFSLSVAANLMYKSFIEKTAKLNTKQKRLFEAVGKLCEECGSNWPRRYFIKYLCRCYGTDCYQTIRNECDMAMKRWINLPELQGNKKEECHDRFIVCGEGYTQMREAFVQAALNEDNKTLVNLLQTKKNKWKTETRFLLVVYREFTMNFLYEEAQQQFSQKVKQFLQRTLMNCNKIQNKELIRDLLTNSIWRHDADKNISPALDLGQQGLCCLLLHCMVLFRGIPEKQTWLSPLINIANNPELMMESYFPTMPQDDLDLIKEALLASRPADGSENPVFHRCPNGHLYVIGDCGRPTVVARCKAQNCGLEIGGQSHVLKAGNIKDHGVDTTDTGHILGRAKYRNLAPFPERSLKPVNCAVMKLLLHMAMYIGANNNAQAICRSIKPDIEENDVPKYLLSHIQKDLRSISTVLGKSVENVLLLIHYLLAEIMNSRTQARIGERAEDEICLLKDKRSRETWEDNFNKRYIVPVLEKSEEILNTVNNRIVNDKRLGNDPLLQLLYETDKPADILGTEYLSENPSVWQFRDRISVDHLMQTFVKSQQNCPVLQQFLEEEHFLRALRFVPGIIRLQKMLIQKYSRRLDRSEALGLTMDKILMEFQDTRSSEIQSCWNDFKQAWENVHQSLEGYGFPMNGNFVYLSKENCRRRMDERTSIACVLPSERDTGLCSYALLFFLLEKQNLFLQKYCQQSKIKYDSLPKVNVKDLSAAHLISYHPDRDLLPMVLANCNYSFEVGQGTKVEYNFTNLERQLMDRFLFTKSVVLLKELDTVVYRSETTNAVVFIQLRDRIKQEKISAPVLSQIKKDLNQKPFPELCDTMDKLDIAISFLKSVGSDPESPLSDFMVNILKIDDSLVSQKAQQFCKCKHIQSLWMTLALEKTKLLENNDKESFDNIASTFKQKLSEGQSDALYEILNNLPIEQLDYLSQMIFDCLLLTIDIPQKDEESVDMSKVRLKEAIESYLYDPPYVNETPTQDWLQRFVNALPKDEDSHLLCCHGVEIWVIINEIFTDKKVQML